MVAIVSRGQTAVFAQGRYRSGHARLLLHRLVQSKLEIQFEAGLEINELKAHANFIDGLVLLLHDPSIQLL